MILTSQRERLKYTQGKKQRWNAIMMNEGFLERGRGF